MRGIVCHGRRGFGAKACGMEKEQLFPNLVPNKIAVTNNRAHVSEERYPDRLDLKS